MALGEENSTTVKVEGAMGVSHELLKHRLEEQRARLLEEIEQFRITGRDNLGYGNHRLMMPPLLLSKQRN